MRSNTGQSFTKEKFLTSFEYRSCEVHACVDKKGERGLLALFGPKKLPLMASYNACLVFRRNVLQEINVLLCVECLHGLFAHLHGPEHLQP